MRLCCLERPPLAAGPSSFLGFWCQSAAMFAEALKKTADLPGHREVLQSQKPNLTKGAKIAAGDTMAAGSLGGCRGACRGGG